MISICMPYRERAKALARALGGYAAHYDPATIEISICDDGSINEKAGPVVRRAHLEARTILSRLTERAEPLNPCVPINIAVNQSSGELINLCNPETIHTAPILERMAESIGDWRDYVIAAVRKDTTEDWLSRSDYIGKSWLPIPPGAGFHFCVLFTRELWLKAGGFDEAYRDGQGCDDNDWCWRVQQAGGRFVYRDDCIAYNCRTPTTRWHKRGAAINQGILKRKWGHLW